MRDLQVYNSLTQRKEIFKPQAKVVTLYTCGPTVYNYAHIGNLRTFVFEDLLRRTLNFNQYTVKQVKNLTDIDDKIIKAAREQGISRQELTNKYTKAFMEDLTHLKIMPAAVYPKATEHLPEMLLLIKILMDRGLAYNKPSGVYFRVSAVKNNLQFVEMTNLEAGASGRVNLEDSDKENPADFALWKAWTEKDGDAKWGSPWGFGRPGWHLECSAMSIKHLTSVFEEGFHSDQFQTIDIHTGGIDLSFPHHQSEIMQSEGCFNQQFVKYWMHAEHLLVDGQKMAKTLGNFYTLRDLLNKGFHPLALRYLFLSVHYRQPLNFTLESLQGATQAIQRINDFYQRLVNLRPQEAENKVAESAIWRLEQEFNYFLNDDLHTPKALAALFDFINLINSQADRNLLSAQNQQSIVSILDKINKVLDIIISPTNLDSDTEKLLQDRILARKNRDWKTSDHLRQVLQTKHIAVEDTPQGQQWKHLF